MFDFGPTHWLVANRAMFGVKIGVPTLIQIRFNNHRGIYFYLDGGVDCFALHSEIESMRTLEECVPQGAD